jgi:antitoxin CcdA
LDAHDLCAFIEDTAMRVKEERSGYAKRAANLSVTAELLDEAKALDINLSATLERALEQEVRVRKRERWLEENRDAIAGYNAWVAEHGVFSPMFGKR